MKSYFYRISKIISLLLLTNISNSYSHNILNGGCREHCGKQNQVIKNEIKLENVNNQIDNEIKNSCINKSLCRG